MKRIATCFPALKVTSDPLVHSGSGHPTPPVAMCAFPHSKLLVIPQLIQMGMTARTQIHYDPIIHVWGRRRYTAFCWHAQPDCSNLFELRCVITDNRERWQSNAFLLQRTDILYNHILPNLFIPTDRYFLWGTIDVLYNAASVDDMYDPNRRPFSEPSVDNHVNQSYSCRPSFVRDPIGIHYIHMNVYIYICISCLGSLAGIISSLSATGRIYMRNRRGTGEAGANLPTSGNYSFEYKEQSYIYILGGP